MFSPWNHVQHSKSPFQFVLFISFAFRFVQQFLFLNMIQTRNHIWTKHDTPLPIQPLIGNRMFTHTALKWGAQGSPSVSWHSDRHVLWSGTRVASSHMTKKQASLIRIHRSSTWKTWSTVILHWWTKGLQGGGGAALVVLKGIIEKVLDIKLAGRQNLIAFLHFWLKRFELWLKKKSCSWNSKHQLRSTGQCWEPLWVTLVQFNNTMVTDGQTGGQTEGQVQVFICASTNN